MIVGVCGFGFSGSGAVLDLLNDYSDVFVADKVELSFIYKPDGLEDLRRAVSLEPSRYFSSDSAIRRFIKYMDHQEKRYNQISGDQFSKLYHDFINSIVQVRWLGNTSVHAYQDNGMNYFLRQKIARAIRIRFEKRVKKINKPLWPDKEMYFSFMDENSYMLAAKQFVGGFVNAIMGKNRARIIAIDQPFCANDVKKEFPFFDDCKAIVVLRDPRDLFVLAKTSLGMAGRFIPTDSVDSFIKYYKGLMGSLKKADEGLALYINFEDLIYKNQETIGMIERFLGLQDSSHTNKSKFDPMVSINNTQLFLKYTELKDDVDQITRELSDYLYDFLQYERKPDFSIESF